ncbi:hypothetical protein SODALDRAFT_164783 [Sodiomyces alkalinus F11]|uniref:Uncharacterized protein n=1 Tax=Sodiomyces alkalinus (strain CBS 110278 / VKM F-3762 / F11) TaxID=1314773 RepID=A0A3N2PVM3_SODAK|nr:hypothetical protein SODALDRAFT_164783 [Sodiomyces alkalinus F11]ROT38547.1 hypothetical protein SODALDRAFT_164783 [Sodiomyces alkalinus F11]
MSMSCLYSEYFRGKLYPYVIRSTEYRVELQRQPKARHLIQSLATLGVWVSCVRSSQKYLISICQTSLSPPYQFKCSHIFISASLFVFFFFCLLFLFFHLLVIRLRCLPSFEDTA